MTRKKNGFWAFCFSFLPGAGEMYMGFMKMGLSLMGIFFLIPLLAVWLNMNTLLVLDVLVWFYGFFHVHNLRAMDDEEFYAVEDEYLFHLADLNLLSGSVKRYQKIFGLGLVILGVSLLWRNIWDMMAYLLPDVLRSFVNSITYRVPQMVVALFIIWLGLIMIRGKRRELEEEDYTGRGIDDGRDYEDRSQNQ